VRTDKNKETIATKWFLVLAKLFSSPNQSIQTLAAAIMAEISIGYGTSQPRSDNAHACARGLEEGTDSFLSLSRSSLTHRGG
jgi:hypothetical protein